MMIKKALVVGGSNGIGLSIATELSNNPNTEKVYILDKALLAKEFCNKKFEFYSFDLTQSDFSIFSKFQDIDTLIITAGFGKLALFKDIDDSYIINSFNVNTVAAIRIIKLFYNKLLSIDDFYCGIMVSIAGFMSSPFLSVYGATKAALKIFIESVNVELEKAGTSNRILNVSPGSIKGTSFNNGKTDLSQLSPLAIEIIQHIVSKNDLFIPHYEDIYKNVLDRYHEDFRKEGLHSYEYKLNSGRM